VSIDVLLPLGCANSVQKKGKKKFMEWGSNPLLELVKCIGGKGTLEEVPRAWGMGMLWRTALRATFPPRG
jgi:hypothetical protein